MLLPSQRLRLRWTHYIIKLLLTVNVIHLIEFSSKSSLGTLARLALPSRTDRDAHPLGPRLPDLHRLRSADLRDEGSGIFLTLPCAVGCHVSLFAPHSYREGGAYFKNSHFLNFRQDGEQHETPTRAPVGESNAAERRQPTQ